VKTPSVTTSIRVFAPTLVPRRARRPTVSPTRSPSVCAIRSAAPRAAIRRGSSTRIFFCPSQGASSSANGSRVVLPAPGGATSTAIVPAANTAATSGSTASIGKGASNIMPALCNDAGMHARAGVSLQQRPLQDHVGDREINHEAGDIDEGGDERCRRAGRVETKTFQQERQHRSSQRAERHNAHQR
jgi:hypothetical protein